MILTVEKPAVCPRKSSEYRSVLAASSNELIQRKYLCTGVSDAAVRNRFPFPRRFRRDCTSGKARATPATTPAGTRLVYRCARLMAA